jgi:DNA-binding NarL/FixJ family response regulator
VAELTNAELIYERGLAPRVTYLFKHAFTQEAAYRSLLTSRRRVLHHRVALTLETLFPDRLEEYYGQLAPHFLEAVQEDEMDKAIDYAIRAGNRNMALLAYAEAVRFYQMVLHALEGQKTVDEEQRCTVLLALGEAQRKAGEPLQALAMNAQMGAKPWLAHTQHAYAVMLLSRKQPGDREQALSLLDEALGTARELGMRVLEERITTQMQHMQTSPGLDLVYPDDLSQREQEVLHLLAIGKSNREIAETLCISLNTVASHVRNILTKTDTTNRTEAAAYAMRHGLRHG